jgi:hypothetical protein
MTWIVGGILWLLLLAAASGYLYLRQQGKNNKEMYARYHKVKRGMSAAEVNAIIDFKPDPESKLGHTDYYDQQKLSPEEFRTITHSVSYTISRVYVGIVFVFSFDKDGRLVGKHAYD